MSVGRVNPATFKFHTAKWLEKTGYAPHVYMFRNLERGQVLYSQFPQISPVQIDKLFKKVNSWDYKKPSKRRDLWKCMCVVNMMDYEKSVNLFQNLNRLRHLRDFTFLKQCNDMRRKNEDGHVWYSGMFRPCLLYTSRCV